MTTALEEGEGSTSRPVRSLLPVKTRYPIYRRVGGPQGRSGQVLKILPPTAFNPRTVQPVASRYTDFAKPAHAIDYALYLFAKPGDRMPVEEKFFASVQNVLETHLSPCTVGNVPLSRE
jgi:hypothetical protein